MASNQIRSVSTATVDSPNGPVVAIMMALDLGEIGQVDAFMKQVAEKFKAHRMCSPPETAALLVTIIGSLPAQGFVCRWAALTHNDEVLQHFMAGMQIADVIRGTTSGDVIEMASLLNPAN